MAPWLVALVILIIAPLAQGSQWLEPTLDEPLPIPAAHFLIGNEGRHDLFAPAIDGRCGAFLGVGGEQNYTLAALAKAERLYLLDRDPWIALLHMELGRRIVASPTPSALLDALDEPVEPPVPELVDAWPAISAHLRRVAARRADGHAMTWLGDPTLYDRIRRLWRAGAVVPVTGDLRGDTAMASIARSASAHGLRFTTIYLSNAEESLPSLVGLAANLRDLPHDSGTTVLRTFFREPQLAADGLWSYQVQALDALLKCVDDAPRSSLHDLLDAAFAADALIVAPHEPGLSTMVLGDHAPVWPRAPGLERRRCPASISNSPADRDRLSGAATRRRGAFSSTGPTRRDTGADADFHIRHDDRVRASEDAPHGGALPPRPSSVMT